MTIKTTNIGAPWTEQEIEILRQMAGKFKSSIIAEKIGRGPDGVLKKIKQLGLPSFSGIPTKKPQFPPARQESKNDPNPLRKQEPPRYIIKGKVEYCMNCGSPVSSWDLHLERMGRFGCKRPAA